MTGCDYCGEDLGKTDGKLLVMANGQKLHFCSSKCEKNYRNSRSHEYPETEE